MRRVLIVDDEYIMRQGLRYMIPWEEEGYQIVGEATNGKDALSLTESLHPNIIICDVVMPLMDGIDFVAMIHKLYPQIQLIVLSGYDKFDYVKQTLINGASDYILKPVLTPQILRQSLYHVAQHLPSFQDSHETTQAVYYPYQLERYLTGHDQDLDLSRLKEHFTGERFCLYAVDIQKASLTGKSLYEILRKKIQRIASELHPMQTLLVMLREQIACLLFCYSKQEDVDIRMITKSISDQLSLFSDSILGICSRSFSHLEQSYEIFNQEVLPCLGLKFYHPQENLLFTEELSQENMQQSEKFHMGQYNACIESRQFEGAIQLMQEYYRKGLQVRRDAYRLKHQSKNMVYHFLDALPLGEEEREAFRYEFFYKIDHAYTEAEYRDHMEYVIDLLLELSQNVHPMDKRIEKILGYINENYQEELRLEDLALRFNFNYSYLSSYFNSQVRESFTDYLNRIRIERACHLLQENHSSIAQISKEVGYSEHSYFCRVFRKITGKTPSAWRKSRYETSDH